MDDRAQLAFKAEPTLQLVHGSGVHVSHKSVYINTYFSSGSKKTALAET